MILQVVLQRVERGRDLSFFYARVLLSLQNSNRKKNPPSNLSSSVDILSHYSHHPKTQSAKNDHAFNGLKRGRIDSKQAKSNSYKDQLFRR